MKVLLVKLNGGLGNQLFQYATARNLCITHNTKYLFYDISEFKNDYLGRRLAIQNFNIKGRILKNKILKKIFSNSNLNKILQIFGFFKRIEENQFILRDINKETAFFTLLKGFWQSSYFFENIRSILLDELTPAKFPVFPEWIIENNSVAVGVRRTDYLTDLRFGFIGIKYYKNAFAVIKNKIKNPLFIIFSDDIEWCKENFKYENIIFFDDKNWSQDYLKIFLISKCKHQIVSNSSFYWWGAWLNTNPEKIVIRPSHPFNDINLTYESLYPEEWVVINTALNMQNKV